MRLEQLNKHEEMSYIEDAEANEAILKTTISKDELCRYLTPLKFLEIETWRKEVPCGEDLDESEVEHRKWRTPIEILLPTAGRDDDITSSSQEGVNESNIREGNGRRKKATSSYSRRRRFFEDVQRQNAEVLRRSNSDATKLETTRPRMRETFSAGEKPDARSRNPKQAPMLRNQNTTENRLRTAYAPANGIPPVKETPPLKLNKSSGHIQMNNASPGLPPTNAGVMTSYFAPGKPVISSRTRGRTKSDPIRRNSAENGGAKCNEISQTSNTGSPASSSQRVSSSSWPTAANARNHGNHEKIGVQEEVQVLPLNSIMRPQTVGEQLIGGRYDAYPRHSKFRGTQRNLDRGWKSWNNKRGIESSFSAATRLYQNSVLPKNSQPSRILEKIRASRTANGVRELSPRNHRRTTSLERLKTPSNVDDTTKPTVPSNHVTKISYAISRGQEDEKSRVTPVPPIEMKVSPTLSSNGNQLPHENHGITSSNGLKYLNADGIIELLPIRNGKATAPWVTEAFSPVLATNGGYFIRHQRPGKTVTFRLGAT